MKRSTRYTIIVMLALVVVLGFSMNFAHAQQTSSPAGVNPTSQVRSSAPVPDSSIFGFLSILVNMVKNPVSFAAGVLAALSYLAMVLAGWLLSAAGTLLNVAMYLTTHLGLFINQSPVIYTVWTIIRDLSSTLLIFFILWAAIQKILNLTSPTYGDLIKNIIIVGVLINFSFFFTRTLIDLSNIVSLQFYNAIAPANTAQTSDSQMGDISDLSTLVPKLLTSGGVSNILMGTLQVSSFQNGKGIKPSDLLSSSDLAVNINIMILEAAGLVVVVITIINFLVIALACLSRIAILIFLLGFSPIWIAAMGMPALNPLAKKWTDAFKTQLLFLPVYLAFLYVALRIITASHLGQMVTSAANYTSGANPWINIINLTVGFGIIIVIINVPILAAVQVSGASKSLMSKAYDSMMSKAGSLAKGTGRMVGRHTVGQMAYDLNESKLMRRFAASQPGLGGLVSKGLSKGSSYGFGAKKGGSYEDVLKAKKKDQEAMHKRIGDVDRSKYSSQAEFDEAQEQARGYQEKYRGNIQSGTIMSFLMDNRAGRQTALGLKDEADLKKNEARQKIIEAEINKIAGNEFARATMTDEDKAQLSKLQADYVEVSGAVKRASGKKKKKDVADLAKLLTEEGKEDKDVKEEKPKEDKPKTS